MTHKSRLHSLTTNLMISNVNTLTFQQPIDVHVVLFCLCHFLWRVELLVAESDTSELFLNLLKGGGDVSVIKFSAHKSRIIRHHNKCDAET